MSEEWVRLDEFPMYAISSLGQIVNQDTGKVLKTSSTRAGATKVGLVVGGVQYARSVKVLVAQAFVPGSSALFDTPINLDGDPTNNTALNLAWRPRWFAWKYTHQFTEISVFQGRGPLYDVDTQHRYIDIVECSLTHGLLFRDVRSGIVSKQKIFPTWQLFDWVR